MDHFEGKREEPPERDDDENDSDNADFFFESDHLALRGNADYRTVLRTIVILEAQRVEATKHIDRIADAEKTALKDPETFVKKLASGESLNLPGPINIQCLPKIKFEKYNVSIPTNDIDTTFEKTKEENDLTVRGRLFDQSKPETFNQLWTCEEQRRLEELLVEYPPEAVEMRRFAKIARALGNRTARQVASRLQKYFQKLHAAGLPVPGRIPRNARSYISARKNRITKQMIKPTTFFPSNYVPVAITDDNDNNENALDPIYYRNGCDSICDDSNSALNIRDEDNTVVVDEPSDNESKSELNKETKILQLIKRVKGDKEKNYPIEISTSDHNGYKCDFCNEDPITGTRWHCMTCIGNSIDFCSDCLVSQLQLDKHHSLDHKIIGLRISTDFRSQSDEESDDAAGDYEADDGFGFGDNAKDDSCDDDQSQTNIYDKDYFPMKTSKTDSKYNYLDPNFLLK